MKDEIINHIASKCPALAQNQDKKMRDSVAKALHCSLCKKHLLACSNRWYDHQPEGVRENDQAKILWEYGITTDRVIHANRPDVTLIDKIGKTVSLIEVAIPWDTRLEKEKKVISNKT
ncbi:uncharacterized protein [Macrobrachium rosenbergii]|uniref:uncharacterized protein n=1 Tax=Macrobrachium rosenbergii TaxID=79674 RepID=UPI0034D71E8D